MPNDKEIEAVKSVLDGNIDDPMGYAIEILKAAEKVRGEDRDDLLRDMRCDAVFESNYVKMPQPLYNRIKEFIKGSNNAK